MKTKGFTLVELLIVVIILGILAAVVVPQFTDASSETQLNSLAENLRIIRGQIEVYKNQHNGTYPTPVGSFVTLMTTKTNPDGSAGGNLGPYLLSMPKNPFTSTSDVTTDPLGPGKAWYYDPTTGAFKANDSAAHNGM